MIHKILLEILSATSENNCAMKKVTVNLESTFKGNLDRKTINDEDDGHSTLDNAGPRDALEINT